MINSILEQAPFNAVPLPRILQLFGTPRFSRSAGEEQCIQDLLQGIPGIRSDSHGNYWVKQGESQTMFSCHTDTVHKRTATERYALDITDGWLQAKDSGVLGADCGAGWLIMLCMLQAGVPGLYVWHRDEEVGGAGSVFMANRFRAGDFKQYKRCIAFDRAGYHDVVTHQGGERCCSDTFAEALAEALNEGMPVDARGINAWGEFWPDSSGVFTDSANYIKVIPECTNISVGYFGQHTTKERQDLLFLADLISACIGLRWEELPTERDPSVADFSSTPWWDSFDIGDAERDDYDLIEHAAMCDLIATYPDSVADLLLDSGFSIDDLRRTLGV